MTIQIGNKAPLFDLPDQTNTQHTLEQNLGKFVFLYFYPKDDTPGCTAEACSVRDNYAEFHKHNVVVFGISADTIKSHQSFAQKFDLPFPLLADTDKTTIKAYGTWGEKNFMGRDYMGIRRTSFLIDPAGKIIKIYEDVKPKVHIKQVLRDIEKYKENL